MPIRPETYIAQRLYSSRGGKNVAVRVALAGITLGVTVMLLTLAVVVGFKQTVTDKVAGFGAHIQVVNYDNNNSFETLPITVSDSLIQRLASLPHAQTAHPFATKPGILKTDSAFQGIVFKGLPISQSDDTLHSAWLFFQNSLCAGRLPNAHDEVLLSTDIANALNLHADTTVLCYFVGEQVRVRRWKIVGLYHTGFSDYDRLFLLGDINAVRRLIGWNDQQASGIELLVENIHLLNEVADRVYFATANRLDPDGNALQTLTLHDQNPQIFAWLDLLDMNVIVIIILMLCVSGFCMVTGLIILILESVQLIAVLKALGAGNPFVRRIFVTEAAFLTLRGILLGNALALAFIALQYFTRFIPLDSTTYYVDYVPVAFPWLAFLLLDVGTALVVLLALLAPSAVASRIAPARTLRFD